MVRGSINASSYLNNSANIVLGVDCQNYVVGPFVWALATGILFLVGLPASAVLLRELVKRQRNGMTNDAYMVNVTTMDLIFSVFLLPGIFSFFTGISPALQVLTNIAFSLSLNGRPLLIACNCVECYMAVVYPIAFRQRKSVLYRTALCVLVWCFALAYHLVYVLNKRLFLTLYAIAPLLLSVPVIVFCDIAIVCALRKPGPTGKHSINQQKKKALQAVRNSLCMISVSYLPPMVLYMFRGLMPLSGEEFFCFVAVPSMINPMAGSAIMPLLYLHNLGRLKGLRFTKCC